MRLFYAPSAISSVSAIALREADLNHELHKVDFASGEQRTGAYLKVNPKGRVPALDIGGEILTETGAILEYIAAVAPDADLVPSDPVEAARMRAVMYYLASTMHVNHAHARRGARWADKQSSWDDMAAKASKTMAESARFIEEECLTGPFVLGEKLTLADIYLYVVSTWLEGDGVDVTGFPKITSFRQTMEKRASVRDLRALSVI